MNVPVSAPAVAVEGLSLRVGAFALRDISFSLAAGETFVILGTSGAGKSLLLETLAGFYRPASGRIMIGGRDLTDAPPEARRIAFMFQDYALFPHLTVAQNVGFGLRFSPRRKDAEPLGALLARLGLEHLAGRKPAHLSGGEQQRVALARALAMEPALFLFDEPLSALDARSRDTLRGELKTFLGRAGVPSIYVTHDQLEALALADKMAVMSGGALLQSGTPSEIFNAPVSEAVANFVGVETVLEGKVLSVSDGMAAIGIGDQALHVLANDAAEPNASVLACIRPEDVALARTLHPGSSVRNQFQARVTAVAAAGPLFKISLDAGFPLVAYVSKQSYLELGLSPGVELIASVKATAVHLIGRASAAA
ncbi:MAG TPA: ABC transporter ATP-binding protein [Rhodocyclaceae bacterium]|nr:ABC transporter ATP-binding protein [Rhodocyclaceae bacterium]